MAKHTFDRALQLVLDSEGLWADHPKDPGGQTMRGITMRTYRAWRLANGKPIPTTADLRNIPMADVVAIYRQQYADVIRYDDLPAGLDFATFDYAVNSGPARAAKELQRVVGSAADGIVGAKTLLAAQEAYRADREGTVNRLCDRRLAFLKSLGTWGTFGKGWSRRVSEVRSNALAMARGAITTPQTAAPAQKADPADKKVSATKEGAGGLAAGVGAAGAAITEQFPVVQFMFLALVLVAVGFVIYSARKRARSGEA